jgi:predicted DNA-binding transcriptional regulator AlpA
MLIDSENTLIDTCAIARLTKTSKSYWEKLRCRGEGPKYIKRGRLVLYRLSDVERWFEMHSVTPKGDDQ